jgi:membrane-associated protease RseP (regulator of RpoE activity)
MNLALGLLIFLPFLTLIISIHELGHFLTARHYGMKVKEYFIGFGPRLWSRRRGELEWGVKALPLGGYVKIAGMNPYEQEPPEDAERLYGAKPIRQRALTIFAGPGTHFVVGAILFAAFVFIYGNPLTNVPVVGSVDARLNRAASPAAVAGLRPGDTVIRVGDVVDPTPEQLRTITTRAASDHQTLTFEIERDGATFATQITPELTTLKGQREPIGRIGILLGNERMGPVASMVQGVKLVGWSVAESFRQIGHVFGPQGIGRLWTLLTTNAPRTSTDPSSVVGIASQVGTTSSSGNWGGILLSFAFITVFIGLINLLPLPPFDGGHLAVLAVEKVRGRAIDMRKLIPVSAAVMAFFVLFVGATMYLDLWKPIPTP